MEDKLHFHEQTSLNMAAYMNVYHLNQLPHFNYLLNIFRIEQLTKFNLLLITLTHNDCKLQEKRGVHRFPTSFLLYLYQNILFVGENELHLPENKNK